ncbi:MAG: DUF3500 domain-containing protein [Acidobacteriaceae bacterium]
MKRRSFLTSSAMLVASTALNFQEGLSQETHSHTGKTSSLMVECANRFIAVLDTNQRGKAIFPFDADERKNWHYIPKQRQGLPLIEMSAIQKQMASALLAAGLSQAGYIKALTIMSLEDVLRVLENDSGETRNPEKYYVSIFGTPSDKDAWGYRIEGHHLSQNYTILNGDVVGAPSFFGANPAEVRQGPRRGLRTLADEDDLGTDLVNALDEANRKIAIVNETAYPEILTGANRTAALKGQPSGLSASKMNRAQFDRLMVLVEGYARNVPDDIAKDRITLLNKAGRDIYFAWAGGIKRGDPHYYRIQTSYFLIELDDTQDDANHIHAVWREFKDDFGEDLLRQHYRTSHK